MSRYRLTVIGDSFSAGWGDPAPTGGYRGWVSRFSSLTNLQPRGVHNLARYGATTRHAIKHQLPGAVGAKAPLVVAFVGTNDLLDTSKSYDPVQFRENLRTIYDALTGANTTVVTAMYPDIPGNLEVSDFVRKSMRRRFEDGNEAVAEVASAAGVVCIDLTQEPIWHDSTLYDPDRLHPGPQLHQLFAEEMLSLIETTGLLAAA